MYKNKNRERDFLLLLLEFLFFESCFCLVVFLFSLMGLICDVDVVFDEDGVIYCLYRFVGMIVEMIVFVSVVLQVLFFLVDVIVDWNCLEEEIVVEEVLIVLFLFFVEIFVVDMVDIDLVMVENVEQVKIFEGSIV